MIDFQEELRVFDQGGVHPDGLEQLADLDHDFFILRVPYELLETLKHVGLLGHNGVIERVVNQDGDDGQHFKFHFPTVFLNVSS